MATPSKPPAKRPTKKRKTSKIVVNQYGIAQPRNQQGSGYHLLANAARAKVLKRIAPGHYVDPQMWESLHRTERLALMALAVVSETSSGTITGAAALALQGRWVLARDAKIVVLGGAQKFPGRPYCIRMRSQILNEHTHEIAGRLVATPARAAFDECRIRNLHDTSEGTKMRAALVAIEGVMQKGTPRAELEELARMYRNFRGVGLFRRALAYCHGRCETPGEALTKAALLELGLAFHEQVQIYAPGTSTHPPEFLGRVDFYVPDLQLIIEFDGAKRYVTSEIVPTPAAQSRLISDEVFRERFLRATGLDVARVLWNDVDGTSPNRLTTLRSILLARQQAITSGSVQVRAEFRDLGPLIG